MDDFHHLINAGQEYISGFYLEKRSETLKGVTYSVNEKKTFSSSRNKLFTHLFNVQENSNKSVKMISISNDDYCEIPYFFQETKMALIM